LEFGIDDTGGNGGRAVSLSRVFPAWREVKMRRVGSSMSMPMLIWVILFLLIPAALVSGPTMVNVAEGAKICVNPSGLTRTIGDNENCRTNDVVCLARLGRAGRGLDGL
jgi:hypothetical protein